MMSEELATFDPLADCMRLHDETVALNEALVLGALRQQELAEAAEHSNALLQIEIAAHQESSRALVEKARLLDLSNDAIIVRDSDHKITSWNKGAEKLYGWTSEEAAGRDLHALLQTEFPQPRGEIEALLRRVREFRGEVWQVARDGRRIPLLCRWVFDRDTGSILTSYTDITDRRALETALADHAAHLMRADRSKDEFLAMLAHELRNPLAPLRNAAEILRAADATSDERQQAEGIIFRQIDNMSRMIDDLLDVSRITEGKIELRMQPVPLEAIFTAATDLVRSSCAARHQHLAISMPAVPTYVTADATRLEQVFVNLLSNACKYGGEGCHISLSADRDPSAEPAMVTIRVRDDGIGIAAELLPQIFDLFVQATRSLDRAHGGLGIGLTLVKRLVKLHGGSIEARSEGLGHGSEFIVRLPILDFSPLQPATPSPAQREIPRLILIVDDNIDSARSMAALQSRRGHETRTAFTGPEALAVAADFHPEVVLLDIGLPDMDGYEVARQLRLMPTLSGAFLVAITGYSGAEARAQAQLAGFDEYLVKPADLDLLREWLSSRI